MPNNSDVADTQHRLSFRAFSLVMEAAQLEKYVRPSLSVQILRRFD